MPSFALDRRVPLALVAGLLLQAAVALWWAANQDSHVRYLENRLQAMETSHNGQRSQSAEVLVRLARIEERQEAHLQLLADIKQRLVRIQP